MQSKLVLIIATISVILGGAIALGFGSAEAVAETIADKFCGIWEHEYRSNPSDPSSPMRKRYFKVVKVNSKKYRFTSGFQYKDQITWTNYTVEHSDGIYLAPSNGKLVGHFISPNFWATHSRDSSIEITLEAKPNGKVRYSERGIIGRTTSFKGIEPSEVFEATKVGGGD